ncbi:hypothetical protein [Methylomonas sp. YC3]
MNHSKQHNPALKGTLRFAARPLAQRYLAMNGFWITTKQPSAVVRRLLESHPTEVEVRVDRKRYSDSDLPWLLKQWCTNRNIRSTNTFEIKHRGEPVFGFHDDINEAWATESERETVEQLVRERVVRVRLIAGQITHHCSVPRPRRVISWIRSLLGYGPSH